MAFRRQGSKDRSGEKEKRGRRSVVMAVVAWLAGVVVGGAGVWLYNNRPRDPIFEVTAITLKGLNLRFRRKDSVMPLAVVDVELTLSIKVTNLNIAPIEYTSTIMDIFYRGDLLGQAQVKEGNQAAESSKVLEVPCKLDGLELTNHVKDLFQDVSKREMSLHATVTIAGHVRLWNWTHNFEVRVTSDLKVDPLFLNVIDQENMVEMDFDCPL